MGKSLFGGRCAKFTQSISAHTKRRKTLLMAALAGLWAAPLAVHATGYTWNVNASGLFDTASNWSPVGTPSLAADTTFFNQPGTYTVTFQFNTTNASSEVDNGNVTWALSGQTYTLNGVVALWMGFANGQTGRLTLLNGSLVTTTQIEIASPAAATGFLTVSSNATLTASSLIRVGNAGQGNLTVSGGGLLTTNSGLTIAAAATGLGAMTVSGAGSTWTANGAVILGDAGTGALTISSGGTVNNLSVTAMTIANVSGSSGTLLVSGAGSSLSNNAGMTIGNIGTGTATVSGGASIDSGSVVLGSNAAGKGTMTVSGSGSQWNSLGSLFVGNGGTGEVDVLSGGALTAPGYIVGAIAGSRGTINVSGNASSFTSQSGLTLGSNGAGTLNVESGGDASIPTGPITLAGGASAVGILQVSGAGSTFSAPNSGITIGSSGNATVSVLDGGVMSVGAASLGQTNVGALSQVTVSGTGATLNSSSLNIGAVNSGTALVTVEKGGTINVSGPVTITDPSGSPTGTLTINTGGTLNVGNGLTRQGTLNLNGGNLNINGGIFNNGAAPSPLTISGATAADFPVFRLSGSSTATANVSSVNLGVNTSGAIEVLNGAHLSSSSSASLGFSTGTGSILIDGAGSNLAAGGNLQLGINGTGIGIMTISNGGSASTPGAVLGLVAGTTGTVNLMGAGSTWVNGSSLTMGQGGAATVNVTNGAVFNALQINLGSSSAGTINVRTGGLLSATTLSVGIGGAGTLNIESGGTVTTSPTASIAAGAGNGTATVTGAGSAWNASAIQIGGASTGSGALNVLAGGAVTTNTLTLNDPAGSATGTLLIDGGNVTVNGVFQKRGTLNFNDGTLTINGLTGTFDNAASASPLVINGSAAGKTAALRFTGGAHAVAVSDLTIGQTNAGSLFIQSGSNMVATGSVVIADQTTASGTMTVDGIFQNSGAFRVGGGNFAGGPGTLLIENFGEVVIGSTLFTYPQGTVRLNNGRLVMSNYSPTGSALDFISGSVSFSSDFTLQGFHLDGLLGPTHTLRGGQALYGNNDLTLGSNLKVDGGALQAFNDLIVSANTFLTVTDGSATASNSLTNQSGGVISVNGGAVSSELDIANAGEIQLHGGTSLLLAANNLNNSGLINGSGQVSAALVNQAAGIVRASGTDRLVVTGTTNNSGLISLLNGGTVEFRAATTNAATGRITGRGTVDARQGVENNGQIAFSGELSDFFGPITNNSGGKIIVTGNGMATFYDTITHNGGAEIRVSAGSTAVFLGAVNGVGSFSGSGTKYFEGGGSAVGPVITPGSTVVEAAASLSATLIREDSLTVNGQVTINTSGGTSHLNHLAISGSTDNWDGVLDLKNNSLVLEGGNLALITNQIKSGLYQGTGITSSAPGSPFRLGSMSNAGTVYSSFQGISGLDGDEVLIRYTRIGDLNLDGTVTISDFIDLASNFNHIGGSTWQMGDVNYDGSVTISDFIDLASNFNQSVSGVSIPISDEEQAMLNSFAAANVPEPAAMAVVILTAMLTGRRRRKR